MSPSETELTQSSEVMSALQVLFYRSCVLTQPCATISIQFFDPSQYPWHKAQGRWMCDRVDRLGILHNSRQRCGNGSPQSRAVANADKMGPIPEVDEHGPG